MSMPKRTHARGVARPVAVVALALLALAATPAAPARADAVARVHRGASARVTMDFKAAPLNDVLHALSRECGVNIVLGDVPEVDVTANLVDTPFEDALGVILGTHGLDWHWDGRTVVVDSRRLVTRLVETRYVDARRVAESLKSLVSEEGMIQAIDDPATEGLPGRGFASRLVVVEREGRAAEIVRLARELDRPPVQVTIEAKFIETTLGDDERLGIRWNLKGSFTGATAPTTFPFRNDGFGGDFQPDANPGVNSDLVEKDFPPGGFFPYASPEDFVFGKLSAQEFSVVMEAIAERRDAELMSAPRVTTLDNVTAQILVGEQVPVARYERHKETGTMEITGYDQQDVGISLWVTPHVGPDGILLEVTPQVSRILEFVGQFNERPVTSTRTARTQVLVRDGETIAIGGLISKVRREVVRGVPLLKDVPLLGYLFRHRSRETSRVELIIFITPHVVREGEASAD